MTDDNWKIIDRIPGWMSRPECEWIAAQAAQVSSWTELGVYCGRSAMAAGLHLPQGARLTLIDRLLGSQMEAGQNVYMTAETLMQRRSFRGGKLNLLLIRADVDDAIHIVTESEVVFIDADHHYEPMKRMIQQWWNKCRILCGHDDGNAGWPGVSQALDELLPNRTRPAGMIWTL